MRTGKWLTPRQKHVCSCPSDRAPASLTHLTSDALSVSHSQSVDLPTSDDESRNWIKLRQPTTIIWPAIMRVDDFLLAIAIAYLVHFPRYSVILVENSVFHIRPHSYTTSWVWPSVFRNCTSILMVEKPQRRKFDDEFSHVDIMQVGDRQPTDRHFVIAFSLLR